MRTEFHALQIFLAATFAPLFTIAVSITCAWSTPQETNFYETLAHDINVKIPDVYGVWRDEANPDEWFCIVSVLLTVGTRRTS